MKPQMLAFSEHGMTDSEFKILKSGYKLCSYLRPLVDLI